MIETATPGTTSNPLEKLYRIIENGRLEENIEFRGTVYRMRSLNDEEYSWRDQFVNAGSLMSIFSVQRAPTLAVATVAIDGVPVEQLPGMLDTPEALLKDQMGGADRKYIAAFNLRKLYSSMPRDFVEGLYDLYFSKIEKPASSIIAIQG
jgi:hypothetical protein